MPLLVLQLKVVDVGERSELVELERLDAHLLRHGDAALPRRATLDGTLARPEVVGDLLAHAAVKQALGHVRHGESNYLGAVERALSVGGQADRRHGLFLVRLHVGVEAHSL